MPPQNGLAALLAGLGDQAQGSRSLGEPLQSVDEARIDQKAVEAAGFRAALAGVEQTPTAQHDLLLLCKGRIERNAGLLLDDQRQISRIDRVHHSRAPDRLEIDGVDRVIGRIVTRVVALELLADAGFIERGIEQLRRKLRLMIAVAHDQERLAAESFL